MLRKCTVLYCIFVRQKSFRATFVYQIIQCFQTHSYIWLATRENLQHQPVSINRTWTVASPSPPPGKNVYFANTSHTSIFPLPSSAIVPWLYFCHPSRLLYLRRCGRRRRRRRGPDPASCASCTSTTVNPGRFSVIFCVLFVVFTHRLLTSVQVLQ